MPGPKRKNSSKHERSMCAAVSCGMLADMVSNGLLLSNIVAETEAHVIIHILLDLLAWSWPLKIDNFSRNQPQRTSE